MLFSSTGNLKFSITVFSVFSEFSLIISIDSFIFSCAISSFIFSTFFSSFCFFISFTFSVSFFTNLVAFFFPSLLYFFSLFYLHRRNSHGRHTERTIQPGTTGKSDGLAQRPWPANSSERRHETYDSRPRRGYLYRRYRPDQGAGYCWRGQADSGTI